jgi:hypothetical protein
VVLLSLVVVFPSTRTTTLSAVSVSAVALPTKTSRSSKLPLPGSATRLFRPTRWSLWILKSFPFSLVRLEPGLVTFPNTCVATRYPCRIYLFFEIESVHFSMFLLFCFMRRAKKSRCVDGSIDGGTT